MFFFWYKPEERRAIESELKRIGRSDLIAKLYDKPLRGGKGRMSQAHYDDKAIGSTYDNPGVGRGSKGKRGSNRQENQRGAYRQDSQRGGYRQNVQRGKTNMLQRVMATWVVTTKRNILMMANR